MVANTDIKFYVHTNNNAPQLQNAYGSMINVLDACLVNGINIGGVSSLTASGTTITALFSSAHNLMQYQVIKITGAVQPEFNGEHRILTVPNAQSVTFELAAAPSTTTATGTITASLPPLGWEKPFSSSNPNGGGKAAYRSKNLLLPSRPFLRVVDELDPAYNIVYAKYAKVGLVEDMTDINTMLGVQAPFDSVDPDKNWNATGVGVSVINGWAKWYYARSGTLGGANDTSAPASGNRNYIVVGTADYFYIYCGFTPLTTNEATKAANPYGFGVFTRLYEDDTSNNFLNASINNATASSNISIGSMVGLSSTNKSNILLNRPIEQNGAYCTAASSIPSSITIYSGYSNYLSSAIAKTPLYSITLDESAIPYGTAVKTVRGNLIGAYMIATPLPLADYQIFKRGKELFIAKHAVVGQTSPGQMVLKIGDL